MIKVPLIQDLPSGVELCNLKLHLEAEILLSRPSSL